MVLDISWSQNLYETLRSRAAVNSVECDEYMQWMTNKVINSVALIPYFATAAGFSLRSNNTKLNSRSASPTW
jgi:ribonucleotide reductase beta subunit family protein with ferritin-like domain